MVPMPAIPVRPSVLFLFAVSAQRSRIIAPRFYLCVTIPGPKTPSRLVPRRMFHTVFLSAGTNKFHSTEDTRPNESKYRKRHDRNYTRRDGEFIGKPPSVREI